MRPIFVLAYNGHLMQHSPKTREIYAIHNHGDERVTPAPAILAVLEMARADGHKLKNRFELIIPIYTTSIANPCFVIFVHVLKMYENTLATREIKVQVARGGEHVLTP